MGFGALVSGRLGAQLGHHRGKHLSHGGNHPGGFIAAAVVLAVASGSAIAAGYHYVLIIVLGLSMGIQNAAARKLGVPDITTTVLTLTITGIGADSTLVGGKGSLAGRRFIAIAAMLAGALVGAALIVHLTVVYPLVIALVLVLLVAAATRLLSASDAAWVHARS